MNIFVFAFTKMNLGDDLFLKILLERYPNVNFHVKYSPEKLATALNEFDNAFLVDKGPTEDTIDNYDCITYIGGSIFMESKTSLNAHQNFYKNLLNLCENKNIPFFYISPNFGPFKTKKYYNTIKNNLNLSTDVCFRDKYSYNLFKKLSNVRYATDAAFNYEFDKSPPIKNSIGISVMDPDAKGYLHKYRDNYYTFLKNNIVNLIENNKTIYLFSFCNFQDDNEGCFKLMDIIPKKYHDNINIIDYNGDLDNFLRLYQKMEYVICGRFHSMILSVLFNHKYFVLPYSNKTTNVIKDLSLTKSFIPIQKIKKDIILELSQFKSNNKIKRFFIVKNSEKQFKALDKWILNNL
jgi:colanic acid/amylovoran biosynthesis protein